MGSKNKRFSESFFKSNGIDAHEVKDDFGCRPVSHFDIYNGKTVTIESKDGSIVIDTELTKEQLIEVYGSSLRRER